MAVSNIINVFFFFIITVLSVLLIIGVVLLVCGIAKKKKPENEGKKHPVVLMVIGFIIGTPALICILTAMVFKLTINVNDKDSFGWKKEYDRLSELYAEHNYNDQKALAKAFDTMIGEADAGDKDAFKSNFSKSVREDADFDRKIDEFFAAYPGGLSMLEFEKSGGSGSEDLHFGHNVKTRDQFYRGRSGDEAYFIILDVCYENTDNPEELGVNQIIIWNLEGYADYKYDDYGNVLYPDDDEYCLCYIKTSADINARLVNGTPYPWTESEQAPITEEEMKNLLLQCENIDELRASGLVGKPNNENNVPNSSGCHYIYELQPENGKPRYVEISCGAGGNILSANAVGEDKGEYFEWLVK